MKMVMAIVRTTSLEGIVKALADIGIKGITISEVKGTGEQFRLYKPYTIHKRIETVVPDERVNAVTDVILENAHTGLAGDGLMAVYPVEYVINIRTKKRV